MLFADEPSPWSSSVFREYLADYASPNRIYNTLTVTLRFNNFLSKSIRNPAAARLRLPSIQLQIQTQVENIGQATLWANSGLKEQDSLLRGCGFVVNFPYSGVSLYNKTDVSRWIDKSTRQGAAKSGPALVAQCTKFIETYNKSPIVLRYDETNNTLIAAAGTDAYLVPNLCYLVRPPGRLPSKVIVPSTPRSCPLHGETLYYKKNSKTCMVAENTRDNILLHLKRHFEKTKPGSDAEIEALMIKHEKKIMEAQNGDDGDGDDGDGDEDAEVEELFNDDALSDDEAAAGGGGGGGGRGVGGASRRRRRQRRLERGRDARRHGRGEDRDQRDCRP